MLSVHQIKKFKTHPPPINLIQSTRAISDAPFETYALGAHEWMIENDSLGCSTKGKSYKRLLKLSGCQEGEFTCNDGQCIR